MRDLGGDDHGWRAGGGTPTVCSVPAAFVAEGGGQPLPPWMEMLDGVGLTATILGFLEVMRVMVFVRNEQMPLKRPQNLHLACVARAS